MKTLNNEDEQIAALNLQRLLKEIDPNIEVTRILKSIEENIEYYSHKDDLLRALKKNKSLIPILPRQKKYKSHFLIPVRDRLIPLNVNDIAYIVLDDKISRVVTFDNTSYSIDKPLDAIYMQLDPTLFFRANRQFIIAHQAVDSIAIWPLSKLFVTLKVPTPEKIIISRARVSEFKDWFTK